MKPDRYIVFFDNGRCEHVDTLGYIPAMILAQARQILGGNDYAVDRIEMFNEKKKAWKEVFKAIA